MAKFNIVSAIGGISDYEDKGIKGSFKFASGLDIRKKTDSLSCQQALKDIGVGVIEDLILWIVPASDGNIYCFGDAGEIYKIDDQGEVTNPFKEPDGKIRGAAEWENDEGRVFLYWATDKYLHRKEIPGQSNWSDVDEDEGWPKSNLEDVEWHTMRVADGALMIANGQYLALVGYDDSYTVEALRLRPRELAKTIIERNNLVVTGSYTNNLLKRGTIYSWNQEAMNFINRKEIPAQGINAMLDTEYPLMQAGRKGGIFYSDFIDFLPITSFPGGGMVNPDGVDGDEGLALFGVFGTEYSGVYSLGRKKKNAPYVLNLDYPLSCDEIGSVKKIGDDIYVSYKDGNNYGLKVVDKENKGVGEYVSLDLVAPKEFLNPVVWQSVIFNTKEMPQGTKIECFYRLNKSGDWLQAEMEGGIKEFEEGNEAVFLVGAEAKIFELKLVLTPSGNETPEIYFPISIYFSNA